MKSNVEDASNTEVNSDNQGDKSNKDSDIQDIGNVTEDLPNDDPNADNVSNDNKKDEEVSKQVYQIPFLTKRRRVFFTTEDEKANDILTRYSELLKKNAYDPDADEYDQEKLPKSSELIERIKEHFQEKEDRAILQKVYLSRIEDISTQQYKDAKLEDVIPDYPHPDKVAERSIALEKKSKKSVIQSTGFELGSTFLFVGLALASGDASMKKIALTFAEAMLVLVPLAHSYKSSNTSINAHGEALEKFRETGDESAFDSLGTGLQTRVPYQHHANDDSLIGALKDSLKEAATVIVDPVGIYKDWKKSPKDLKHAFGLKAAVSNPYHFGVIGGALRNLYLNGIQAKSTGIVLKNDGLKIAKEIKYKLTEKAYSAYNAVFKTDHKPPKAPIVVLAPAPRPADDVKFIHIPSSDGKVRRIIRTEMPAHSNISSITTTADPDRMLTMRNAAQASWKKDHGKIATGLVGIGAAGVFCLNIAPYVGKAFQEAAQNPNPVSVGFAAAWGLTIAMGAAAAKHFMHDREKIHVALQSKQTYAAFKDNARAHILELRKEFQDKVNEAVENKYVTPSQFDDIIQAYRMVSPSIIDEEVREKFEKYFPKDDEGRRTTTLFSHEPIVPIEEYAPD